VSLRVGRARPLPFDVLVALLLHVTACSGEHAHLARIAASPAGLSEARVLVGLDRVQSRGYDGTGVVVAVIDSGIDGSHPDLVGRVIDEACFCSTGATGCCPGATTSVLGPGSAADDHGHGTHVAGILASQGTHSPRGGAPGVQLVAVKLLSSTLGFCCMQDLIDALSWVASAHPEVKVINLSLGTASLYASDCDVLYSALGAILDTLRANGVLVVAASGNDRSSTQLPAPACMASVLSAGAVWDADVGPQSTYCTEVGTAADQIACYSNASPSLDLLAPGGAIESTWRGGGTQVHVGTSHAAPLVSACAATLLQADPSLNADSLETLLESTGPSIVDPRNGLSYPRLDCAAALANRVPLPPEPDAGADPDAGEEPDDASTEPPPPPDAGAAGSSAAGSAGGAAGAGQAGMSAAGSPAPDPIDASTSAPTDAGRSDSGATPSTPDRDSSLGGHPDGSAPSAGAAAEPDGATGRDGGRRETVVAVRGGGCACSIERGSRGDRTRPIGVWALIAAALMCRQRSRFRKQRAGRALQRSRSIHAGS
jgi:subtilisin family serine protease